MSIQDIRPNPLDTSVYLANIYQILADPNAAVPRPSVPSLVPILPPFSPPRYAIWVNSLWFLSLVISLTCAVLATSLHQWSRRYIRYTQLARCSSEKRARIRAFFADGVNKMHLPRAVEALPALIHLSLFLFFVGLVVFLFNVNHGVFISVIWWIGFFSMVYLSITLMPIFWHDSPYYAPLSSTVWLLHAFMPYALYSALAFITHTYCSVQTGEHFRGLRKHHRVWMLGGVRKAAEEAALEQSQGIYLSILDWTIGALGDDDTLEKFFEAIPGFFNSELVKIPKIDFRSHRELHEKLRDALNGFLRRTLSSNSIIESVKERRLNIYLNATNAMFEPQEISDTLSYVFIGYFGQLPQSIGTARTLARQCTADNQGIGMAARCGVASILQAIRERDHRWIALARDQFGLPERALRDNIAHGDDSVLLAIFLHRTRQLIRTDPWNREILPSLSKFDVQHTFPGLQTEFCALWNEIVLQAMHEGIDSYAIPILRGIRHFYIALHQGTDAAPTAFDISTADSDSVLRQPSSYPLCNIVDNHPNPSTHDPVTASPAAPHPTQLNDPNDSPSHRSRLESQPDNSAAPRRLEDVGIIPGLSSSPSYAPHSSTTTDPVHTAPLATSVTDLSIHEHIATATPYTTGLVSVAVSYPLPQSSLSPADLTPNIVRNDEPTSDIPMVQMGEGSQTHAGTLLPFPHPNSFPVTVAPSTPPFPHSVSVQRPGDFLDTP